MSKRMGTGEGRADTGRDPGGEHSGDELRALGEDTQTGWRVTRGITHLGRVADRASVQVTRKLDQGDTGGGSAWETA